MPTVAAASAGASLIPNSSFDESQLALGLNAGMYLFNADRISEPLDLALAVAGDEHHTVEAVRRSQVADE